MFEEVAPTFFQAIGNRIIRRGKARPEFKAEKIAARKFASFFGTSPFICSLLWAYLEPCSNMPLGVQPVHLLWALMFLKVYATESVHAALAGGVDEKTFRKWSWIFVHGIADLEAGVVCTWSVAAIYYVCFALHGTDRFAIRGPPTVHNKNDHQHQSYILTLGLILLPQILWSNRKLNAVGNEVYFVTVDGTDFRIFEQRKPCFWTGWWSEKFNHPGVRYEICVSIINGDIVWINGPFPAGAFSDLKIFRQKLMMWLGATEKVDADEGYEGESLFIRIPSDMAEGSPEAIQAGRARARQETMNRHLKQFNILHQTYRHNLDDHGSVLRACAVTAQLGFKHGGMSLFE